MSISNPFQVVKHRYLTEKSKVLQELKTSESSATLKRCNKPKYVFIVDKKANKFQIAKAIEEIYKEKNIVVKSVNTVTVKPKKRRVRGKLGYKAGFKKAVITLAETDSLDEV